jgi:hypothetical protein
MNVRFFSTVLAGLAAALMTAPAAAQAPQAGGHVHYAEPPAQQATAAGAVAPRLQNLGTHVFPVSTRNRQAQRFINQGINLAFAFNHAEARRSFAKPRGSIPTWRWPIGDRRSCSDLTSTH